MKLKDFFVFFQVFLAFFTLLLTTQSYATSCSSFKKSDKPQTFILAMGANRDGLRHTDKDVKKMTSALEIHFPNANVCKRPNASVEFFDSALDELKKVVKKEDNVFIFFSGHGGRVEDKSGDEKDCCDETLVFMSSKDGASDDFVIKKINQLKSSKLYLILDTCHSAGVQRADGKQCDARSKRLASTADEYCSKNCPVGRSLQTFKGVLYAATAEDKDAYETKGGGWFSVTFAEELSQGKNGGIKAVDNAFNNTIKRMKKESRNRGCRQIPKRLGQAR